MKNTLKTLILAVALSLAAETHAQVFVMTEKEIDNNNRFAPGTGPLVPYQGGDFDQTLYTPLGGGMALLAALGGAYLIGKRRKEQE